ncbi:MAG: M48 family metalloprotease, partial [Dehalococcoidales bacterium]|nr:M48 family metalloprotease [Dehalococcoidales bacterium]
EISHVKNRDVLLMALCAVLLGTIVMLSWYASRFMLFGSMGGGRRRSSSKGGSGGGAQLIIIAVGIILMILAPIFAQFIYFAISRKREYLADASSALYTRYPEGLASALEKLSASDVGVKSANKATEPMYIINPFRKRGISVSELSSTHPPTSERIRILRSMAGGASFTDYDQAYRQVRKANRGLIPASALGTGAVGLRAASPGPATEEPDKLERTRETSDVMWRLNNYRTIDCECGTRLRVPPNFREASIRCPHCGRINKVP